LLLLKWKRTVGTLKLQALFGQDYDAVSYLRWNAFKPLLLLGTKISVVA